MKVFIDDVRNPPNDTWVLCRTYDDVEDLVIGPYLDAIFSRNPVDQINEISFDHDLGSDRYSGKTIAQEMVNLSYFRVMSGETPLFAEDVIVRVHSMNPVGARNIADVFCDYFRKMELEDASLFIQGMQVRVGD